jgi:hypothetical protein
MAEVSAPHAPPSKVFMQEENATQQSTRHEIAPRSAAVGEGKTLSKEESDEILRMTVDAVCQKKGMTTEQRNAALVRLKIEPNKNVPTSLMPLFREEELNGLEDGDDDDSDEEEEEEVISKKDKKAMLAAIKSEDYATLPYPIIVDSGAAESVLPRHWCPQAKLKNGPMKGNTYYAANGQSVKNERERLVSMVTKEGQWKNMTFQVCDVTRPLASVSKIVEAGHSVVFHPTHDARGSYIQNYNTGEKTWLTPKDGVYVLETKVAPSKHQTSPSFARQGQ